MNYKKIFLNTTIIFILCSIFHFIYNLIPNFVTSLFFPVNESIWEHLKMIFSATVLFSFIYDTLKKEKNTFLKAYIRSMATIIILLILYLPLRFIFGEIMIVTLIVLYISIFIGEIIVSKIEEKKHYRSLNLISAILLIINLFLFIIFTYYPPKNFLFLDTESNKYGIDILNK